MYTVPPLLRTAVALRLCVSSLRFVFALRLCVASLRCVAAAIPPSSPCRLSAVPLPAWAGWKRNLDPTWGGTVCRTLRSAAQRTRGQFGSVYFLLVCVVVKCTPPPPPLSPRYVGFCKIPTSPPMRDRPDTKLPPPFIKACSDSWTPSSNAKTDRPEVVPRPLRGTSRHDLRSGCVSAKSGYYGA